MENWLTRLMNEIKTYPNIRLAVSVRSPLEDSILPEGLKLSSDVSQVVLDGFASKKDMPLNPSAPITILHSRNFLPLEAKHATHYS